MLAAPLVITLFHGGQFDAHSVRMTSMALQAYAIGLLGFSFVKVLVPAFFAREDTRTPVKIGLLALATNLVVGVSLAWYFISADFAGPHLGLAAATSLAAVLNAVLLFLSLRRTGVLRPARGWLGLVGRVVIANVAMCVALSQLARPPAWWLSSATPDRVLWIAVSVAVGAGVYGLSLFLLGLRTSQLRLNRG
jgi:putative peptidoglycan lipid II flippase